MLIMITIIQENVGSAVTSNKPAEKDEPKQYRTRYRYKFLAESIANFGVDAVSPYFF